LAFDDAVTAETVEVKSGTFTLSGVTGLNAGSLTGALSLPATAEAVTIDGGEGSVTHAGGTLATARFGNTGKVTFSATPTINDTAASFSGPVEFTTGITLGTSGKKVTFSKDVLLPDTAKITFGDTTAEAVTLKEGVSIVLKATAEADNKKLVTATTETKLTAGGATTLTAATAGTLTIGTSTLTVANGTLSVPTGATLVTGTTPAGLTVAAGSTLNVAGTVTVTTSGAGLVLTGAASSGGAKLTGEGKVSFGNGSITGGASGAWQAVGATSIAFTTTAAATAAITGTGTGPVLAGLTDDGAAITLAAGHTNGDGVALTVSNTTIDISDKGSIVFPYVATTAATLVLKGPTATGGALKLGSGTDTNTNLKLTSGGESVAISGTALVIQGDGTGAGVPAGLIKGGATAVTNDATITGKTAAPDVTIKAGATLDA
jgi:hypothetical protein